MSVADSKDWNVIELERRKFVIAYPKNGHYEKEKKGNENCEKGRKLNGYL